LGHTLYDTWIRDFEPELKSQSFQWKHSTSPCPKKCQQSKVKPMIIDLWQEWSDSNRVPPGSTVTGAYYTKLLKEVLRPKIRQKCLPCSPPVSSFCTITHGHIPHVQYRKFWKIMDDKCFPPAVQSWHEPTRLWLVPKIEETTPWEKFQQHYWSV
jgi:hypothetical protein